MRGDYIFGCVFFKSLPNCEVDSATFAESTWIPMGQLGPHNFGAFLYSQKFDIVIGHPLKIVESVLTIFYSY
jgi:hypothetical protein